MESILGLQKCSEQSDIIMWAQLLSALLGIWLMAAPGLFGFGNPIADNDHILGPVIATLAIVSCWEATRNVRLFNLPFSAWLLLAPWVLHYGNTAATLNDMAIGILVFVLCFFKGKIENRFGGGWSSIWKSDTIHAAAARKQPRA
jgi:hypothetical protein